MLLYDTATMQKPWKTEESNNRCHVSKYLLAVNTVIRLPCCSCFMEALEYLFKTFYVFTVELSDRIEIFLCIF